MNEQAQAAAFETLLLYLKHNRGFDFTGYKRTSLRRRVGRRMAAVKVDDLEAYQDYLEVHPREFEFLFNTILINVTSFFRDKPTWDYVADEILPGILKARGPEKDIRVWSAGCASGEEPYSVAMLLAEALGLEEARRRVKIYATDVDEVALSQARHALYTAEHVEMVPKQFLEAYFVPTSGGYIFNHDLRSILVFGRHDLMQDAPISRLDLLVCRNTLIYFNRQAQNCIVNNFHFALRDTGYLFLGKAEMLLTHADLFSPEDVKHRVFSKVASVPLRRQLLDLVETDQAPPEASARYDQLHKAAFESASVAQVVVDRKEALALANERARADLDVDQRDLGRPFRDLQIYYRPLELRSLIDQVRDEGRSVRRENVERIRPEGEKQFLDIVVAPLRDSANRWLGVAISFVDVTRRHDLHDELEQSKQALETAYEELQSTNEEMETMNEELQSTNAELQAMNDELRQRTLEADRANAFLRSVVAGVDAGLVVVDRDLRILLWNERAEDLWGLRAKEVEGLFLMDLDIGLPVRKLKQPLRRALEEGRKSALEETVLEAINRRGQQIHIHVTPTPQLGSNGEIEGLVLLMENEAI